MLRIISAASSTFAKRSLSAPGHLTLLYPKWLPGHHSPLGPIASLAGIEFTAGGRPLTWRRDPVDVYAFHVDVPGGIAQVQAQFQYLAPTDATQGRIATTADMTDLQWNTLVLYPAGYYVRRINVEASLKLPEGWKFGTALEIAGQEGSTLRFKPTNLDTLVDSPVFAGRYVRQETLARMCVSIWSLTNQNNLPPPRNSFRRIATW